MEFHRSVRRRRRRRASSLGNDETAPAVVRRVGRRRRRRIAVVPAFRVGRTRRRFAFFAFSLSLLLSVLSLPRNSEATLASPHLYTELQPDGTETPPLSIRGNPSFSYSTDVEGYTVLPDPNTGFVVYGRYDSNTGDVVATEYKPGDTDPRSVGDLEVGATPSEEALRDRCGEFCVDEVEGKEGTTTAKKRKRPGFISLFGGRKRALRSGDGNATTTTTTASDPDDWREDDVEEEEEEDWSDGGRRRRKLSVVNNQLRNLVISLRFADHAARTLPSESDLDVLFNAPGGHVDLAPTGSVRDVFHRSSYGELEVVSRIYPWIALSRSEAYYAGEKNGFAPTFHEALIEALRTLDDDPNFTFRTFDADDDKSIDAITFLHSGYGSEWGGTDCHGQSNSDRIWSHKWKLKPDPYVTEEGIAIRDYHISPALYGTCGSTIGRIGTVAHELAHFLGLPDLYGGLPDGGNGIGSYGLMGNSWGYDNSQLYPPIMSPWSKAQMKWLKPLTIEKGGRYVLPPSAATPACYKIDDNFPDGEYLLIENRQPESFDSALPGGGLAVWHIDEKARHRTRASYPDAPGGYVPKDHYRVSVVQADGSFSLERGLNRGDEFDIFRPGSSLLPGDGAGTHPNTDSYQGNAASSTGIQIFDIIQLPNGDVQFSLLLNGESSLPPTSSPTSAPTSEIGKFYESKRNEILNSMAGGTGSYGNMFDVVAVADVNVTSLDVHARNGPSDPPFELEVYTKVGTFLGSEYDPDAWTKVCCATPVRGHGLMKRTPVPTDAFFDKIPISRGETRAFYVTGKEAVLRYTRGGGAQSVGSILNSDLNVKLLEGDGVGAYPFGGHIPGRVWNGVVHYEYWEEVTVRNETNDEPDGAPSPAPSASPTTVDSGGDTSQTGDSAVTNPWKPNLDPTATAFSPSFSGENGSYGNMFDILSDVDVTIQGMDVHTDALDETVRVQIRYKRGTHVGSEKDPAAWSLICDAAVTGRGYLRRTPVPLESFADVPIDAYERIAFYVTLTTPNLRYSNVDGSTNLNPDPNSHVWIAPGTGLGGYPFGETFSDRLWNGSIHYAAHAPVAGALSPTPPPTPLPQLLLAPNRQEIVTTFASGNSGYGCMFDVTVKEGGAVVVTALDLHIDRSGTVGVKVYTKKGTYVGFGYDPTAWTLVADATVAGLGVYRRTPLPPDDFDEVLVEGGQTQAFYVALDRPHLSYSDAAETATTGGSSWAETDDLIVKTGAGLAEETEFSGLYEPRTWNGAVRYGYPIRETWGPTGMPTSSEPTIRPSGFPTVPPTDGPSIRPTATPSGGPTRTPTNEPTTSAIKPLPTFGPTDGPDLRLETTFRGENGSYGNMFTIRNVSPADRALSVLNLEIHTDLTTPGVRVEVYAMRGPYVGHETRPDAWTLVCNATLAGSARGFRKPTPVPPEDFLDRTGDDGSRKKKTLLMLEPGDELSFYVTLRTKNLRYSNGSNHTAVYVRDANLAILEGSGVGGYPFDNPLSPRVWNGAINYELGPPAVAPSPTPTTTAAGVLETTRQGGSGAYGNMFDVSAIGGKDVVVTGLNFYTDVTIDVTVEVYVTRSNVPYRFAREEPSEWIVVASGIVTGLGPDSFTPSPDFVATVSIPAGRVRGFYVTLTTPDVRYTRGASTGAPYASDGTLEIREGAGVPQYPFGESVFEPRVWNGAILYSTR